ncbi:MAG: dienelactone hydrolase family protein [Gammaproteobacteria bacterium]
MGTLIELTAADGHKLAAWKAMPAGKPKGGLVIIQEIFGMTEQMKRCTERFAAAGYVAILPAMFDRKEREAQLGYGEFQRGGKLAMSIPDEQILADVEAARLEVAAAGKTAITGYCWGGTVAYLAACQLEFACAVSHYGSGIGRLASRMSPKIPVLYHFGGKDAFIPPATIDQIRKADPTGVFHIYAGADHGFACDDRESHHPAATALAEQRTLEFLDRYAGT